ncbi:hypothetical protein FE257_004315 [Aspergillus nanangensis]|uniref:PUM-HD domain-containing protein n=1 Tax=Aspergillus nanangensis TaxID=2582783 RepID=A0AAD4GN27_ASPNN|nr:hypothetical protein FE257_004315 [Aspergillus nanangensis]
MSLFPSASSTSGWKHSDGMLFPNDGAPGLHALAFERQPSYHKSSNASGSPPDPLVTSKLGNSQPFVGDNGDIPFNKKQKLEHSITSSTATGSEMEKLLAKLSPKPQASDAQSTINQEIFTKLSEKQALLERQQSALLSSNSSVDIGRTDNSSILLPPSDAVNNITVPSGGSKSGTLHPDTSEVFRLKQELLAANSKIALQEQELAQTRVIKHTLDQALGPPSESDFTGREFTDQTISSLQSAFNASNPSFNQDQDGWNAQDDFQSDISDALSAGAYSRARGYWIAPAQETFGVGNNAPSADKAYSGPLPLTANEPGQEPSRFWGSTISSPAAEFTSANANVVPWGASSVGMSSTQTYISPLEPINYRRLLDKNVSCDWRYIVDKIVCNNDQQASIFLQQKLKVGTSEQKFNIIEAIVHQAYPLMINRFGNFLVQRCFEHGTAEQIVAIAHAIRGNTLNLSMDPFGCHVIQKAFDCVPEEQKAVMVHELLRRIPETVIHRYACHVWQKLFELRWSGEPPQIMAKVNEALRGMWHEVALGETGSLVVQNIFENCVEDEKRPAIEEVLAKIDLLAHGQFGNWCIQHICEHGAPHDKSRAVKHILLWSVDYSMDQFASKIVEKCLKIGGSEFLDRYLTRVCTGRSDRPRMPLIDRSIWFRYADRSSAHALLCFAAIRLTLLALGQALECKPGASVLSTKIDFRPKDNREDDSTVEVNGAQITRHSADYMAPSLQLVDHYTTAHKYTANSTDARKRAFSTCNVLKIRGWLF